MNANSTRLQLYLITVRVTYICQNKRISLLGFFLDLLNDQYIGHLDWGGQGSKGQKLKHRYYLKFNTNTQIFNKYKPFLVRQET